MLHSFTKRYTDESTEDGFAFTFYCDLCNNCWKSSPISFSHGTKKSFWKNFFGMSCSLWKAEHKDAFEKANREGMLYFNRCTVCNRWVCDDDFSEEENKCIECCREKSVP